MRTHTKQTRGNRHRGRTHGCKTCFAFFVTNTMRTCHLSCTDFEHFWNKKRELVCTCINRLKRSWYTSNKLHISNLKQIRNSDTLCFGRIEIFIGNAKSTTIYGHFLEALSLLLIPNNCYKSTTSSNILIYFPHLVMTGKEYINRFIAIIQLSVLASNPS